MKVLLDTNVLLWWLLDDVRLDDAATATINGPQNEVIVSVVSLWEIAIKVRIGKLEADLEEIERILNQEGVALLGIASAHLRALGGLPIHHRDPFDHLLIAQAIVEDAVFLTEDRQAALYPVKVRDAGRS
ncbi:type II toxin-antitoxin system VapC family toxin [Caulobacter sp.]|uniref:type II toxin-antitoxin system VapC family toxin n=1 Tax=Caulobacter sp. TaxID=78 RepID=UPI001B0BEF0E|nr:type II toxin-antitoxin system VapC family toxin [Caulobacter sp.]MBO9544738.1 type II toxin-antitoxin system VapC family toxin [Caulobacter sp.]